MQQTVQFKEKCGDRFFIIHDRDSLYRVLEKAFLQRHEEGYYETNNEDVKKDIAFFFENGKIVSYKALNQFMVDRSDYEYESWRVHLAETY